MRLRLWHGSYWRKIKKSLKIISIITALIAGIVLIYVVVRSYGTGFDGYNQISISTDIAPPPHKITRIEVYQPGKALWDWLQLLIIPAVLAVAALLFNRATTRTEQKIALDKQREDLLQAYLDRMSELLLEKSLATKPAEETREARNVARVRTITILFRLDARRIGYVFTFLRESGLMSTKTNSSIISLYQADLSYADLSHANLTEANFYGANLIAANLNHALLYGADLSDASLYGADLSGASLRGADLSHANLSHADLNDAELKEANFSEADLSDASLRGADLKEANFSGADLSYAILMGAKHVTPEQLEKAKSLKGAVMPDGLIQH